MMIFIILFIFVISSLFLPWIIAREQFRKPLFLVSIPAGLLCMILIMTAKYNSIIFLVILGVVLPPLAEVITAQIFEYNRPVNKNHREWKKQQEEKEQQKITKADYLKSLYSVTSVDKQFMSLDDIGYGFLRFRPDQISIFEMTDERTVCTLKERVNKEEDLLMMAKDFYKSFIDSGLDYNYEGLKIIDAQLIDRVLHDESGPYCLILGYGLGDGYIMSDNIRKNWPDWYMQYAKDIDHYDGVSVSNSPLSASMKAVSQENFSDSSNNTDKDDSLKYPHLFSQDQIVVTYDKDNIYDGYKADHNKILYKIRSSLTTVQHGYKEDSVTKYEIYDSKNLERIYIVQPYFDADDRLFYLIDKGSYISNQPLYKAVVYNDEIKVYEGSVALENYLKYVVRKPSYGFSDTYYVYRMK